MLFLIGVAIFLTFLVGKWAERAGDLKVQKYNRCKQIEAILVMEQHTNVDDGAAWQGPAFRALLVLFGLAWIALFIDVVRD